MWGTLSSFRGVKCNSHASGALKFCRVHHLIEVRIAFTAQPIHVFWYCYRGRQYLLGVIFSTVTHMDKEYNELFSVKHVMCHYHCFHQTTASKVKRIIICGRTRMLLMCKVNVMYRGWLQCGVCMSLVLLTQDDCKKIIFRLFTCA